MYWACSVYVMITWQYRKSEVAMHTHKHICMHNCINTVNQAVEIIVQVALAGTQVWWTTEVNIAFSRLEEGYETAIKDYYKKQVSQLHTLINLLLGDMSKGDRQRIMTICTIDVHARDVVGKIVAQKVDNAQAFLWLSQLRHRYIFIPSDKVSLGPYDIIEKSA